MKRYQHVLLWLATLALCAGVAVGNAFLVPPDWAVTLVDSAGTSVISGGAVKTTGGGGGGATQVEGRAANGATLVGNPVPIAGLDASGFVQIPNVKNTFGSGDSVSGTNYGLMTAGFGLVFNGSSWDRTRGASAASGTSGAGLLGVGLLASDGVNFQLARMESSSQLNLRMGIYESGQQMQVRNLAATGEAQSRPKALVATFPYVFNGTTYDTILSASAVAGTTGTGLPGAGVLHFDGTNYTQVRSNIDVNLTTQTGATTTFTSADQTNHNGKYLNTVMDMTAIGTGSVTLEVDGKDTISGKYYAILTGAAVTSNSTNLYTIGPSLTAVANATANAWLPHTWRIKVTANNANPTTYTVGYSLSAN